VAGLHLLDPQTQQYNRPFLTPSLDLVDGYGRTQGVVFRRGDRRFEGREAREAIADLTRDAACIMVNRNHGSGTRSLIDGLLAGAKPPGYAVQPRNHHAVAAAVTQGRADWGVTLDTIASKAGLGFLPVQEEQYDFVIPKSRANRRGVIAFKTLLAEPRTRAALAELGLRT
jgi:putative molybdopterin biosynthesis protein